MSMGKPMITAELAIHRAKSSRAKRKGPVTGRPASTYRAVRQRRAELVERRIKSGILK